jgi:type VI secretion system protein ImpL
MKSVIDFLKHPDVKLAGITLLFALFIWFIGPYFAFAGYYPLIERLNRFWVIFAFIAIILVVKIVKFLYALKARQQLVDGMSQEHDVNRMIDAEASELQKKFQHAFTHLKTKSGQSSLLELPWYMIIGQPGSGKTTLFANSGLKFPLAEFFQNRAIQGVGGTKNCDWWITQDAVLLDTAGRYTSRDSHARVDDAGWQNFLGLIKKFRRKPLNGLLISFSIADLLSQNETEIRTSIQLIKQRVTELNQKFDTEFPLYIFLTKTDLLAGFSQFFEDLTQQEREQVLGLTFTDDDSEQSSIDQEFRQKYTELLQALERRQWARMDSERDPGRKIQVFSFVRQLATLSDVLSELVVSLSTAEAGQVPGVVRGVYLTSGTQSGSPVDRLIDKLTRTFGVKNKAQVSWNNSGRSFFVRDLLQKLVFAEADASRVFDRYEKRRRMFFRAMLAGFGIVSILLISGWTYIFFQNQHFIQESAEIVERWDEKTLASYAGADIKTVLPILNDFRDQLAALETIASFPLGLGLSQTPELLSRFEQHYQQSLNAIVLPALQQALATRLARGEEFQRYDSLKAYLMLGMPERREVVFLADYFKQAPLLQEQLDEIEKAQLQNHVLSLVQGEYPRVALEETLLSQVRRSMLASSLHQFYYQQFKQQQLKAEPATTTLDQLAGVDWRSIFVANDEQGPTISNLFTQEFYTKITDGLLDDYIDAVGKETWVLGTDSAFDAKQVKQQLLSYYARDYQLAWQSLLSRMQVKNSFEKTDVMQQLDVAGSYNSPLLQIIGSVVNQTQLDKPSEDELKALQLAEKDNKTKLLAKNLPKNNETAVLVAAPFTRLHVLDQPEIKANWQKQLTTQLQDLAFNLAQPINEENAQLVRSSVRSLKALAYSQPQPLKNWLNQLVDNAIGVTDAIAANEVAALAQQSKAQLLDAWQQEVVPVCQSALALYPFTENADLEISLQQLADLFASDGVLQQFFNTNLQPLLVSPNRPLRLKPEIQAQFQLSDTVLKFYERLFQIRQLLYPRSGNDPQLNYGFTPLLLDTKATKFRLNIQGQELIYQFGKATTSRVQWPGPQLELPVEYAFVRADGSELTQSYRGLFALYRLFDSAQMQQKDAQTIEITLKKDNFLATYQVTGQGMSTALLFKDLRSFRCPSTI